MCVAIFMAVSDCSSPDNIKWQKKLLTASSVTQQLESSSLYVWMHVKYWTSNYFSCTHATGQLQLNLTLNNLQWMINWNDSKTSQACCRIWNWLTLVSVIMRHHTGNYTSGHLQTAEHFDLIMPSLILVLLLDVIKTVINRKSKLVDHKFCPW